MLNPWYLQKTNMFPAVAFSAERFSNMNNSATEKRNQFIYRTGTQMEPIGDKS
jgi:hypothetical protein